MLTGVRVWCCHDGAACRRSGRGACPQPVPARGLPWQQRPAWRP
jgi:hypothetical protein